MAEIKYKPIGIIHSPFKQIKGTPIQPTGAKGIEGKIEIAQEYVKGLKDLEGFSHIILIYHFHLAKSCSLEVTPFLDNKSHGVFATRAPKRPNPIGLSVVRLKKIQGSTLFIEDIDIVDGTPLLDLKPFVPELDPQRVERIGWLSEKATQFESTKADERFK